MGQPRAAVVLVEQHHLEDGLRQDGGRLARGGARHAGELLQALVGEIGHRPGQLRPVVEGARPQGGVVLQQAEDGKGLPAGQAAQVQLGKARGAVVLGADVDEAGALANGLLAGDVHREALLVEGRVDHQQGLGVADVRVGGRGHHVRGLQLAVDEVGQRGHVVRAQGQPGQLLGEVDLLVGQAGRDEHRHLVAAVAAGELLEPHAGVAQGLVEARLLQLAPDAQQGPAQALGRLHVAVAEAALLAVVAAGARVAGGRGRSVAEPPTPRNAGWCRRPRSPAGTPRCSSGTPTPPGWSSRGRAWSGAASRRWPPWGRCRCRARSSRTRCRAGSRPGRA